MYIRVQGAASDLHAAIPMKLTNEAGQAYTVFTVDQQLYCVILDIIWTSPQRFPNFIPRIGGMHWLMSSVGSVGVLMENSGLQMMMKSAFAGTEKMLTGKKFPTNVRALRFVVVKLLHGFIDDTVCCEDLDQFLKEVASKSVLAKHWVNNVIKPVFLMLYICTDQEGEFRLHLYACKQMMPYFLQLVMLTMLTGKVPNSCFTYLFTSRTRHMPSRRHMECNLDRHNNRTYIYVLWKGTYRIDWCNHQTMGNSDMGKKPSFL